MKKVNLTLSAIGKAVGTTDSITHSETQPHRDAYAVADAETKKSMMAEFVIGYIMGNAKVSESIAKAIYDKSRPTPAKPKGANIRTADEQACYKRGYAKWLYHVVAKENKLPKKVKPQQEVSYRFTPEAKAKAKAFLSLVKNDFDKAIALLESVAE